MAAGMTEEIKYQRKMSPSTGLHEDCGTYIQTHPPQEAHKGGRLGYNLSGWRFRRRKSLSRNGEKTGHYKRPKFLSGLYGEPSASALMLEDIAVAKRITNASSLPEILLYPADNIIPKSFLRQPCP